jgi:hypothetical protein
MANFSKVLSGAATGAAMGAAVPIIGAPIGAAAGFLGGLLFGGDDPEMPQWTDVEFAKLEEEFPEYAAQIKANQLAYGDLSKAVAQQQQGPSAREQAQQQEYMAAQAAGQAMGGMSGQPVANAMMADAQARTMGAMYDAAHQRAIAALQLQQQAGGALAQQYGALGQLQNSARQGNNENLLANAQGRYGHDMAGWSAARQNNQNNWQNILNAGATFAQLGNSGKLNWPDWGSSSLSDYDMAANEGQGPLSNALYQAPEQGNWFNINDSARLPVEPVYQTGIPSFQGPQLNTSYGPVPYDPRRNGYGF